MNANGALTLADVRAKAMAALAPTGPEDPEVLDLADAVHPPCLMLNWDSPFLTFRTGCLFDANFMVMCIAGRLEPLPGVEEIERLATYALTRMRADTYSWPLAGSQANRVLRVGNVPYFGATLTFRVSVAIEETEV